MLNIITRDDGVGKVTKKCHVLFEWLPLTDSVVIERSNQQKPLQTKTIFVALI